MQCNYSFQNLIVIQVSIILQGLLLAKDVTMWVGQIQLNGLEKFKMSQLKIYFINQLRDTAHKCPTYDYTYHLLQQLTIKEERLVRFQFSAVPWFHRSISDHLQYFPVISKIYFLSIIFISMMETGFLRRRWFGVQREKWPAVPVAMPSVNCLITEY